jgi:glutathione synthase/RimK-type ligase-like ATP-grasp enzyme
MLAIYEKGDNYTARWISYCIQNSIKYLPVDLYDSDLIQKLKQNDVKIFLCHFPHNEYRSLLAARSILLSLELAGIQVFPNHNSNWHFDDKIAQKYLFESLGLPHAPMHLFYDKASAQKWFDEKKLPLVFKLKSGAGSSNVILIKTKSEYSYYLRKMFGTGIKPLRPIISDFAVKFKKSQRANSWEKNLKKIPAVIRRLKFQNSFMGNEKGYFLLQDFMPGNQFDTRVAIINDKAFGFRRMVRKNDFRASGSGDIDFNPGAIDLKAVKIAFEAAKKIGSQSMAFDFIYDKEKNPVIVEISYGFASFAIGKCPGYWDENLKFTEGSFLPEDLIIRDMLTTPR